MKKKLKIISTVSFLILFVFMFSSTNALAYNSQREFTVVIDAGHGGKDSGAVNSTLKFYEKNLNLDIAKAIQSRLTGYGINVVMTRNTDVFLELADRSNKSNEIGADLFISVHNDTQIGNGDGAHIIHSVKDNNGGMSKTLATNIGNSIENNTSQNLKKYSPIWSRYSSDNESDYYSVIRRTEMPAVIVEHAFMNDIDIKAVDTLAKRNIMGNAVADGIYKTIKENFSGWMKYKDVWKYYHSTEKAKAIGWEKIDGKWYYFDDNGFMQTDWQKVDNVSYYLDNSGAMQIGWRKINDTWYYLDVSGAMQTGWKKINNAWYYLDVSGEMQTGWKKINNIWYYLDGSGEMQTGWKKINNIWYYLDVSGAMQTGWKKINNIWYYLDGSGAMQTGWRKTNDTWYYLDGSGAMQIGWLNINNNLYYLKSDGAMVMGEITIDGTNYLFNENGKLVSN